jgi:hypothetical protein
MKIANALLLALAVLMLPVPVHAQGEMPVICTGLAGCGQGIENTIFNNVLPAAVVLILQLAAGGALIFIVIAGVRMLLAYGDDSKAGEAKLLVFYALGGLALVLLSANIVSYVTTENFVQANPENFIFGPGGLLESVIRIVLILFNAGFVVMIVLAGVKMLMASGAEDEFKKAGAIIKWAIIGAIVVNMARALVQAFLNLNF